MKNKVVDYVLLYSDFTIYSLVSVLAKFASMQDNYVYIAIFVAGEILLLGVYALIWQQVLKRFTLITAMSNKGITIILGMVWSVLIFHEGITIWNIIGAIIIIFGMWMVSSSE